MLPVSYLGFAAGAAYAWALEANNGLDMGRAVSLHAFHDATGRAGRAAFALGNVYQAVGFVPGNASALFEVLQRPAEDARQYRELVKPEALRQTLEAIDEALRPLAEAEMRRPDAQLVRQEFEHAARLLRHGARRALFLLEPGAISTPELDGDLKEISAAYEQLWLARNRPGGLKDSVARFEEARRAYQS